MNNGNLGKSARLQAAMKALKGAGGAIGSLDLAMKARSPAIGTVISELRANGAVIDCELRVEEIAGEKRRRWYYTLRKAPEGWA